jgi:tetratricopeptide (TPR) repeat protein
MGGIEAITTPDGGCKDRLSTAKKAFQRAIRQYSWYLEEKERAERYRDLSEDKWGGKDDKMSVRTYGERAKGMLAESESFFLKSVDEYKKTVAAYEKNREEGEPQDSVFLRECGKFVYFTALFKMEIGSYKDAKSLFSEAARQFGHIEEGALIKQDRRLMMNAHYEKATIEMGSSLNNDAKKSFGMAVESSKKLVEDTPNGRERRCLGNAFFELGRLEVERFLMRKESEDEDYQGAFKTKEKDGLGGRWVDAYLNEAVSRVRSSEKTVSEAGKGILRSLFKDNNSRMDGDPNELFEKAIKMYEAIPSKEIADKEYVDVYRSWGEIHSMWGRLFRYKYMCLLKRVQELSPKDVSIDTEKHSGLLNELAECIAEAKKHFEEAISRMEQARELDKEICKRTPGRKSDEKWIILGAAKYRLSLLFRLGSDDKFKVDAEKEKTEAIDVFKSSDSTILEILVVLSEDICWSTVQNGILNSLLDGGERKDAVFFNNVISKLKNDGAGKPDGGVEMYKKVYIRSMYIVSRLQVKSENGKLVAHYTRKATVDHMLFGGMKLGLFATEYFNDPKEGEVLLDYLYGDMWKSEAREDKDKRNKEFKGADMVKREEIMEQERSEYVAFAISFSFDFDSLNQFRLYGKEGGREGTGLALIFKRTFFAEELTQDRATFIKDLGKQVYVQEGLGFKDMAAVGDASLKEPKDAIWTKFKKRLRDSRASKERNILFRCAYFDPKTKKIVTVGQKEEYLFYRDGVDKDISDTTICKERYCEYKAFIDRIVVDVGEEMKVLFNEATGLEPAIVGQLTLNLRYLVKDVAFREEQECRILKTCRLVDDEYENIWVETGGVAFSDDYKLHLEYGMDVSQHVERVCFGPKAGGIDVFRKCLVNKGMEEIGCERSRTNLA